jgi:Bacterial archaeo-eukaryotic release factor family 10
VRAPSQEALSQLLRWEPPHGVVSVYVDLQPADRGEGWRIELRNGLGAALERVRERDGREARRELEATAKRILDRFPPEAGHPEGRTQIGFVEVASKPGREEWFAVQMRSSPVRVVHDARPVVRPLVTMLDDGAPRGVAAVSAERVRLLRWALGTIEELEDWGLEIFSLDWRERKAQRAGDPARVQGAKASGRDQFDQRLEANREHFLRQAGRLATQRVQALDCDELLVLGDAEHVREFADGAGDGVEVRQVDGHNVISARPHEIAERLEELLGELNRSRELELVRRVKDEAHGGTRGAVGVQETLEALEQGRVAHLVFDASLEDGGEPGVLTGEDGGLRLAERLIELALTTGARVTPVEGEAAEALAEAEGVAGLLRY